MLDVLVLIAMAVTAAAFAAGLTLQAGLPWVPVLIGAAALFLLMAGSYFRTGRGGGGEGGERIDDLEQALEVIDSDLQRLDRVEDGISRLHGLHDKVEQMGQALSQGGAGGALTGELQDVYNRIETVRAEVATESRAQRQKIIDDLSVLEGLISRLSGELAEASAHKAAAVAALAPGVHAATVEKVAEVHAEPELELVPEPAPALDLEPEPLPEPEPILEPAPEPLPEPEPEIVMDLEPEAVPEIVEEPAAKAEPEIETLDDSEPEKPRDAESGPKDEPADASEAMAETPAHEPDREPHRDEGDAMLLAAALAEATADPAPATGGGEEEDVAEPLFPDDDDDDAMLDIIREGIEQGRVDLYLQPTVTLTDRKVRYFEGLTRIRKADGTLVMPGDYMPVAKRSALMPLIDNVLVVRSVQVLRRLGPDAPIKGVFANISMHSLLDPDYFPELIEFMEENDSLSDRLVFEISQAEMQGLNESEIGCLDTLGALGFTFCLDNVVDLEAGFDGLGDRHFKFAKVSAESFLTGPGRNAADLKRRLDGMGMQLIVEKVEKESDVAQLLDHGIEFAQGHLFAEARPMNAALSRELENANGS